MLGDLPFPVFHTCWASFCPWGPVGKSRSFLMLEWGCKGSRAQAWGQTWVQIPAPPPLGLVSFGGKSSKASVWAPASAQWVTELLPLRWWGLSEAISVEAACTCCPCECQRCPLPSELEKVKNAELFEHQVTLLVLALSSRCPCGVRERMKWILGFVESPLNSHHSRTNQHAPGVCGFRFMAFPWEQKLCFISCF